MESLVRIFALSILYVTAVKAMDTSSQIFFDVFEGKIISQIVKTIVVDQSGNGNFKTVQSAIDSVPFGNNHWIKIFIREGMYNEKVSIPRGKSYIQMEGNDASKTIIQYNDGGDVIASPTFRLYAEFFVAIKITFKNTYNEDKPFTQYYDIKKAPAAALFADKAAFFGCRFFSIQDTLGDLVGRHYFEQCYIKGGIDFIWGGGQSIYQSCVLDVMGVVSPQKQEMENGGLISGSITAQGRGNEQDTSGFVFSGCSIVGAGRAYLGRPNRAYSRVLFYNTNMNNVIDPRGWDATKFPQVDKLTYAEVNCNGPGANKNGRVAWEKNLSTQDVSKFINPKTFLDIGGWIETLPPRYMNVIFI